MIARINEEQVVNACRRIIFYIAADTANYLQGEMDGSRCHFRGNEVVQIEVEVGELQKENNHGALSGRKFDGR